MAKHESEFAEDVAEKLAAIADAISREASLIREHRWSEVNWNYLERKLPIDDLNSRLPDGKTGRQVNLENIVVERFARPYGRWSKKQTSIELPRLLGLFHPQFPP